MSKQTRDKIFEDKLLRIINEESDGNVVRLERYFNATITKLSTEYKHTTFYAITVPLWQKKKLVHKWAYYLKSLEDTLVEAITENRKVFLLVHRHAFIIEGEDEITMRDIIVSATLSNS